MTSAALPANPFPGMNPYLESAGLWPDAHTSIIIGLRDFLVPRLQPDYGVRVEQRVFVAREPYASNGLAQVRVPDAVVLTAAAGAGSRRETTAAEPKPGAAAVAVALPAAELLRQRYLRVLRADNMEVVAVIEVLSPANKSGADRRDYLGKRAEVRASTAHLVEIDLLRAGRRCRWLAMRRRAATGLSSPTGGSGRKPICTLSVCGRRYRSLCCRWAKAMRASASI